MQRTRGTHGFDVFAVLGSRCLFSRAKQAGILSPKKDIYLYRESQQICGTSSV